MAKKRIKVEVGSGNVFADLGFPNAKELKLKVQLAVEVNRVLEERQLSQEKAAKLLRIRQPHVSELVRYRLDRFSVERLMHFVTALEHDVVIEIRPRARAKGVGRVRGVGAA